MNTYDYPCHTIRLEYREAVEAIRLQEGHGLSSHAFVSLFLWQRPMELSLCLRKDAFFVRVGVRGENAWMFPCGSVTQKLDFLRIMVDTPGFSLHYVREEDMDFLEEFMPGQFQFTEARGDAEYVYYRASQLDMPGRAYKNLRTKVRRARDRHDWQICTMDASSLPEVVQVMHTWTNHRGSKGDLEVALLALQKHVELGLQGIVLRDKTGVQAVALGSVIAPGVFDLHVTKTLLPGLDGYLKWELYQRLPSAVEWIDQEEDLDLPGLRTNKLESQPDRLIPLWKGVPKR